MINTILYIIKTNLNMIKTIYNSININTVKIQFISVKRILADLKAIFYIERILSLEFFKLGRNVITPEKGRFCLWSTVPSMLT